MHTVMLPAGERVPALGLGTWRIGDKPSARAEEIATLQLALDQGVTLIDTAEMYGDGRAEELIGEALQGRREQAFIVSKVLPQHAGLRATLAACERSLRRLRTDRIDLYLLHWRGGTAFGETLQAFRALQQAGKIRYYGVSNLDTSDMEELRQLPGGAEVQTNQVLYNLAQRGIEWDLLPWLRARRMPVMAYSPLDEGRLLRQPKFVALAARLRVAPAQLALAWLLARDDVIAIPKTSDRTRLRENVGALGVRLADAELSALDALFPPPDRKSALQMY
jgi:diketogulonate reductase-like aldo/keto reductase